MRTEEKRFGGRRCQVFADEAPEVLLVEPMDERDLDFLDRETAALKAGARRPFALWSAYRSDAFDGIAAASPSVWYPGNHFVDADRRTARAFLWTV